MGSSTVAYYSNVVGAKVPEFMPGLPPLIATPEALTPPCLPKLSHSK